MISDKDFNNLWLDLIELGFVKNVTLQSVQLPYQLTTYKILSIGSRPSPYVHVLIAWGREIEERVRTGEGLEPRLPYMHRQRPYPTAATQIN